MKNRITPIFKKAIENLDPDIDHLFLKASVQSENGLSYFEGKVNSVEISEEIKVGVLVCVDKRWGSSSLEFINDENLSKAIGQAKKASQFNDKEPELSLAPPASIEPVQSLDPRGMGLSIADYEKMAATIEQTAKKVSSSIKNIPHIGCGYRAHYREVMSSSGMHLKEEGGLMRGSLSVMASGSDGRMVNAQRLFAHHNLDDMDLVAFAKDVAEEAVAKMNPQGVASGKPSLVLSAKSAAHLLGAFSSVFSGDLLYRHLTKLEGRLGKPIASDLVTVRDGGDFGFGLHAFDAEGTPARETVIIDKGVLHSFIHNRYTAAKCKSQTTGNAHGGIGGLFGVGPGNLMWDGHTIEDQDLFKSVGDGLYITELVGASASPISGDFSYGALGFKIEKGKITHPVADFTLAGNFFDLLQNIKAMGSALEFFSPSITTSTGGRLLHVEGVSVSGSGS